MTCGKMEGGGDKGETSERLEGRRRERERGRERRGEEKKAEEREDNNYNSYYN